MSNDNNFLTTVRIAIGQPATNVRTRRSAPEIFQGQDHSELLLEIKERSDDKLRELAASFNENGVSQNIKTTIVSSHEEAAGLVVELVRSKTPEFSHNKHLILHDHPDLNALQLWKRFNREAVTVHTSYSPDREVKDKTIASFIGITSPDIAVAESATLVELNRPGRPRSTSLVPSIHIAIINRKNIVSTLEEAYALLKLEKHLDSFLFITGPSKTADIEAHMVHGAHGPKELHVIIISEPTPVTVVETEETDPTADATTTDDEIG